MSKKEACIRLAKTVFSFLLVLLILVGCGEEPAAPKKKKKKKIIKKIIVQSEDVSDSGSSVAESSTDAVSYDFGDEDDYGYGEEPEEEDSAPTRAKRELPEKESGKQQTAKQEYAVKTAAWQGPNGYRIVYAAGDRNTKSSALKLQSYFKKNAGVTLAVTDDLAAAVSKEILVGNTNRHTSSLKVNAYSTEISGQRLMFSGGHFAMVETAVDWFVSLKYTAGKVNLVSGTCDHFAVSVKDGYRYVWGDEFGGNSLDMNKWCFEDKMAGTNMMPCLRDSSVVNVNEGLLKMSAVRYYNQTMPMAQYATNSSVCTQNTMSYQYGYMEIRAMVPICYGAWPSFWLLSDQAVGCDDTKYPYNVEIDVFEAFSSENSIAPNIHKWYKDNSHSQYNRKEKGAKNYSFSDYANLINEYHTYGFEWTPEKMVMSVDGKDYMTFSMEDNFDTKSGMEGFAAPLFVVFNNFIYAPDLVNTTASNQVNNTDLPFEYFVDYVRLYQRSNTGSLNFPDTVGK